eukprot:524879-Pelagomonas_calceolata.AAC.7
MLYGELTFPTKPAGLCGPAALDGHPDKGCHLASLSLLMMGSPPQFLLHALRDPGAAHHHPNIRIIKNFRSSNYKLNKSSRAAYHYPKT